LHREEELEERGQANGADEDEHEEVDTSDLPPELRMDQYDEEDDIPLGNPDDLGELGEYGVQDHYDVALAVDAVEDDSDAEDDMIRETDSLLIVAHTEDDYSYLEVQVLDEDANLYVHHDITLPSFPLCLAWLDCPPHTPNSEEQMHMIGNYIAVGTFEPAIEIWNVDVLDPLEPSCVLGGLDTTQKKTKKGKKKGSKKPTLKADSHLDAVMALCWNKEHRQLLASGSADCSVKLWDVTTQQCSFTFTHHRDKVSAVRWHPQEGSVLATGAFDKSVAVLDARTPDAVSRFELGADLEHLEWDPFRPFNLTAATEDGVVTCKDVRAMDQSIFRFQAHDATVSSISYSPCVEGLMATASLDKTVKLWDVHAPEPFGVAYKTMAVGKLVTLQFSSDDPFALATGGSKGIVAVWDASVRVRACGRN
jgi:periodic tryptophan protein 1